MTEVGLIGLGLLGSAIAERLLAARFQVIGFDVSNDRCQSLVEAGGTVADSALSVAGRCRVVVLSLPTSDIVEGVLSEMEAALNGHLVIDTTTGSPDDARRFAVRLQRRETDYLDATVVGSSQQTRDGDAIVLVGGATDAFHRAQPVLQTFSREQFATGASGTGAAAKLVVNLVLGLNRAVLAEALNLARCAGMDLPAMLTILRSGAAYSRVMDNKGDKMLKRDFAPQARLDQHAKDVRLILELGAQTGASLPLSEVHQQLLARAAALGHGQDDNIAVLRAFEEPHV